MTRKSTEAACEPVRETQGGCHDCLKVEAEGRKSASDPIHCRECHRSWTGLEAQHCVRCHITFDNITQADLHRYHKSGEKCWDPARHGWREKRPGVWTSAKEMSTETKTRMAA